ncbi:trihelix transcription factor GT-2-like [Sesamum indicum]|uniref:Trihelix transcription factor GT-2-like n=1 Tax=Sesamum indicum TaxID=4182 RepID=A0A6I9V1L3_SESIN|nr:trihelix transcription factor GT-2-like [Sesamum indicum]
MMLGVSGLMGSSGDGAAAGAAAETHESGGGSGGSSEVGGSSSIIPGSGVEESERSGGGGNRWPRQETLALLKIRSDMDVAFRDSNLKGPLWEEVSRKMAELGFQRSAKKCKEKFENVYKYHKRTKDGRSSKPDGKTYRFFDQLEALENTPPNAFTPPPPRPQPPATIPMAAPANAANLALPSNVTVSSTSPTPLRMLPPSTTPQTGTNQVNSSPFPPLQQPPATAVPPQSHNFQPSYHHISMSLLSNSTSSSTSSDEDIQRRRGRKRKWKDYFERLMKDVIQKQEELQRKFLDTLEKRERDRMAREEAWRVQEMARMNREHELLVQERSMAAAKDAAVIAFLQKVTDQHNLQIPISNNNAPPGAPPMQAQAPPQNPQPARQSPTPTPPPPPLPQQSTFPPPPEPPAQPASAPSVVTVTPNKILDLSKTDNGGDNLMPASSSRWPKAEVQALINLRTSLDLKYQDNGPKGPLWEEISAAMGKLGYNRSAKRCKEKWENINKYFKKVKESNKKRPEDSKTCPYFHQLDAIYKERARNDVPSFNPGFTMKPENPMVPIMARPEQQWPLPEQNSAMHDPDHHDNESGNNDHEEDDDEDDEDEDEGGGYEIITNKQPSSVTNTAE